MNTWRLLLLAFLSVLVWHFLNQFFFCSQFKFTASSPFQGEKIVNPYDTSNPDKWIKCNFHAHSTAWKGVTNGEGTSPDVHHAYDSLNYRIHCVSNYHSVDTASISQKNYIPAYEHGYNILKTHQLVLGSEKVCWLDYILPQTLSNKQNILNSLSADSNAVVILNHPAMRKGYEGKDLAYLSNYHCMEVLNPAGTSFPQWDAALSAGKPVFIVGNDDIHNVIRKERLGRMCTFVNANHQNPKEVLSALKSGKSYGVIIGLSQHHDSIPKLTKLALRGDTISLQMDSKASEISFIGQDGRKLETLSNTAKANYILKPKDHYARAVITYPNGTNIFLNPVFYSQLNTAQQTAGIDIPMTMFHRTIGFCLAGAWIFVMCVFVQGKKAIYVKLPFLNRKRRKSRRWKKQEPAAVT